MSEHKEIPSDIKNDIKLAFDLYKNENNKINKLKGGFRPFCFEKFLFSVNNFLQ